MILQWLFPPLPDKEAADNASNGLHKALARQTAAVLLSTEIVREESQKTSAHLQAAADALRAVSAGRRPSQK